MRSRNKKSRSFKQKYLRLPTIRFSHSVWIGIGGIVLAIAIALLYGWRITSASNGTKPAIAGTDSESP
jgi:hypothetical protein